MAHYERYMLWAEDDDAKLRELVAGGQTFSQIGTVLGRTKGSCIGRAHRLKLEIPPKPPSNSPKAIRERAKKAGIILERVFRPLPAKAQDNRPQPASQSRSPTPRYEQPEASTTAFGTPRTLMQLKDRHCRWPVSGERDETLFCGAQREGFGPYCTEHRLIAWRPTPRQNLAKLAKAYR